MSFLKELFSKPKPLLSERDKEQLLEIKKDAYLREAVELMKKQGQEQAKKDLGIKEREKL